ncbi:FtsX-like permease family protein [Streptomyces sp. NPDC048717]|uniref:ABC transporter permease n=1 Tax=Streptomyces sp. NPDC048717 TaxID=3154928 RepID=UPI003434D64B
MLSLALRGMRTRWVTFVGSFVALALGVGLIATMGLALAATFDAPERGTERFAGARVVVQASRELAVGTPIGVRTSPLANPPAVPRKWAHRLAEVGAVAEDRTFPVSVSDGAVLGRGRGAGAPPVGHPWGIAAATPYRLSSGRAPAAPCEVVVTTGPGARIRTGDRIEVGTPEGDGTRTVVGTVPSAGFETALFFTAAEAARIAPRIDRVTVDADPAAVRAALGDRSGMTVLAGADRRRADPDPDRDEKALVSVNALLGTAAGITAFVSVFVVASTFTFAVAQRRREFGLLRMAGATPGQVRRMVYAEALAIGVLAAGTGCALGRWGAPRLAGWMSGQDIAPAWFRIGEQSWPLHVAFWTGLTVALAGVTAASFRAGRTGPTAALREAAVDSDTMPWSRRLAASAVLLAGLGLLIVDLATDPGDILKRKTYLTQPMFLIVAFALLAPVLMRPLTRLLTWLPARLPGAVGMLARQNAVAGVRRTAAVAAPVIVTVALACSLPGTTATIGEAKAAEVRAQSQADFIASAGGAGRALPEAFLAEARAVPGVTVSASRSTEVTVLEEGTALVRSEAHAVDSAEELAAVSELPVVAGSLSDLDDHGIVVNEEWLTTRVGEKVPVWLGDGRRVRLRIAAVLAVGTGSNGVYVTAANAAGAGVDRADIAVTGDTDRADVERQLRAAGAAHGVEVMPAGPWLTAHHPRTSESTRLGLLMILAIALVYTGIALANTLVMATTDRARDLALLRLTGATKAQVLRLVAVESVTVVAAGAVLGAAASAVNLLGVRAALGLLDVGSGIVAPWLEVAAVTAVTALLAAVAATLPAAFALRTRPVELAGARE